MSYAPELGLAVLEALLEAEGLGLVLTDRGMQHIVISRALGAAIDGTAQLTEPAPVALNPAIATLLGAALRRTIETATIVTDLELTLVDATQAEHLTHWRGHCLPIRDRQQRIIGAAAVLLDASAQAAATLRLQHSELLTRTLFESTPVGMCMLDAQGQLTDANPALHMLLDAPRAQLLGRGWLSFLKASPTNPASFVKGLGGDHPPCMDHEVQFIAADGTERVTWMRAAPLSNGAAVCGHVCSVQDMTQQLRLTDALRHANAALEERVRERTTELQLANTELEAFSYSVSHDLRAPLRAISGYAHLLLQKTNGELPLGCAQYLRHIAAAAAEMGRMIQDLLRLSRSTQRELEFVPVDLSALVSEITLELHALHAGRSITTIIEPDCTAHCDPALLKIALHNLLENAWKYTSSTVAARVEFGTCMKDGDRAWFVRDNGVGFDMAESGRLFAAFERLSSSYSFDGTGIGLATVRRVIQAHGGAISAASEPAGGATFYFTLRSDAAHQLAAPTPRSSAVHANQPRPAEPS